MQSQQKPAEQKRTDRGKIKGKIKAMDTLCDFATDRSCFQWASSKGTNHQKATGNWQEYMRTQKLYNHQDLPDVSLDFFLPYLPHTLLFSSQHLYFLHSSVLNSLYVLSTFHLHFSLPFPALYLCLFKFPWKNKFHPPEAHDWGAQLANWWFKRLIHMILLLYVLELYLMFGAWSVHPFGWIYNPRYTWIWKTIPMLLAHTHPPPTHLCYLCFHLYQYIFFPTFINHSRVNPNYGTVGNWYSKQNKKKEQGDSFHTQMMMTEIYLQAKNHHLYGGGWVIRILTLHPVFCATQTQQHPEP